MIILIFQLLERRIPDFQLNAFRVLMPWLGFTLILSFSRQLPKIPKQYLIWCIPTSILQNITSLIAYVAVSFISLASYQCITNTVLLISGLFIHTLMNRDKLDVSKIGNDNRSRLSVDANYMLRMGHAIGGNLPISYYRS